MMVLTDAWMMTLDQLRRTKEGRGGATCRWEGEVVKQ